MKYLFFLLLFLQLLSCTSSNKPTEAKGSNVDEIKLNDTCVYSFKNDTIYQTIKIVHLNKEIVYDYQVNNFKQKLSIARKGKALEKETENMQLGEDENGNAYPINVYELKDGNCWISISIDNDKKDKITIIATPGCLEKSRLSTPITSIGILRKVK